MELTKLTTESSVTVPSAFAEFNNYRVGKDMGVWGKAPPWPRGTILLNKPSDNDPVDDWFQLPTAQGAVLMVHEQFHKHWWITYGRIEENEAWEITAHVWHQLELPHSGPLFWDITASSEEFEFPLPW